MKNETKKAIARFLCVCMLLTMAFSNAVFVFAEVETGKMVISFAESPNQEVTRVIDAHNLFIVEKIAVDTGEVAYNVSGDSITLMVSNGEPSSIMPHTKKVTSTEESTVNSFPNKVNYSTDGYVGELKKDGAVEVIIDENGITKYIQKYSGDVTDPEHGYYTYKVTIDYSKNSDPEIGLVLPEEGQCISNKLKVEGFVKDENIGDILKIYYTFDTYNDSTAGTPFASQYTANGDNKIFSGDIGVNLNEGNHTLYIWAADKKGARSQTISVPFSVDTTPPAPPAISQDPGNDIPTNKDVVITIAYPDNAVDLSYKIGQQGTWEEYTDTFSISVNEAVYAACSDTVGNRSEEPWILVTNIDKTPPEAPAINVSEENTDGDPIDVTIVVGEETGSGIKKVQYSLDNQTDWKEYEDTFKISAKGTTVIYARAIDNAGNISEVSSLSVRISSGSTPGGQTGGTPGGQTGGTPGGQTGGTPGGQTGGTPGGQTGGLPQSSPSLSPSPTPSASPSASPTPVQSNGGITEPHNTRIPGPAPVDLAIFLNSDKSIYSEEEIITFTISYKNKSRIAANDVVITAEVPEYTTVVGETYGGAVKGKIIEWKIGSLEGNGLDEIKYTVKAGQLEKAEVNAANTATISFRGEDANGDDDKSTSMFLLYSSKYKNNFHAKYISGYQDNTFRPDNKITRAEVAVIMANILKLDKEVPSAKAYTDVNESHWAYNYIYAVTKAGLFTGYKDDTFHPNSFITRAEFATVLANYLKLKNVEHLKLNFSDISGHWARNFIEEIYRVKLIAGYVEGEKRLFKPDANITRVETVSIINKMLFRGPLKGAKMPFEDVAETHWGFGQVLESSIDHYYERNDDQTEAWLDNSASIKD